MGCAMSKRVATIAPIRARPTAPPTCRIEWGTQGRTPALSPATERKAPETGVGSGVIHSMRQVGGAVGLALMGAIVATRFDIAHPIATDYVSGYQLALRVAAVIALAGAVIAVLAIGRVEHPATEPAP